MRGAKNAYFRISVADVNPQFKDLYRRDQERLAGWPPKFRGEGPFLPTGRRRHPRLLYATLVLAALGLAWVAGTPWKSGLPTPSRTGGSASADIRPAGGNASASQSTNR